MSSDVSKGKHICSNERHLTLYDAVNFPYSEVNGSKTSNISNNRRGSPEENEGSPDDKCLASSVENDVIQNEFESDPRNNHSLHLHDDQDNNESNLAEDETYDSDDSNAYVRRRVAELNLELSKEKEYYFTDNYEKKAGRVNFHPQLVYSRIISPNSLNDSRENENDELTKLSHTDDDSVEKSSMNANPGCCQEKTSIISGSVNNIKKNNLGRQVSLNLKENNIEKSSRLSNSNNSPSTLTRRQARHQLKHQENMQVKVMKKHKGEEHIRKKETEDKRLRDKKVSDWLKAKVLQRQSEEELRRYENEEQQHLYVVHSREACEQAFKQWLKRKNREVKEQKRRAKERMKITRQLMRGNHDWQHFMGIIQKSDVFKILL